MKKDKIIKHGLLKGILLCVISVIGFIVFYMGVASLQGKVFAKGNYLSSMIKSPYSYLMYVILMIVLNKIIIMFYSPKHSKVDSKLNKISNYLMIAIIPLTYIVFTSVIVVRDDGIYDYSFYNLKGEKYSFTEIDTVNTGFIDSGKNKGEFYYNIELENGKKLKLAYPSMIQPSKKYELDTWSEYVVLDKYIMDGGALKTSSENGAKYVDMDKIYTDKLLNVIRNK